MQVPVLWQNFLLDQRGPRLQMGSLSDRALSLRSSGERYLTWEELKAKQEARWRLEASEREEERVKKQKTKSDREKEMVDSKVYSNPYHSGQEEEQQEEDDDIEEESDEDSDWEWEDEADTEVNREYNKTSLKYFSRDCDRYKISDRAAAKLGNALMKDLGLVSRGKTKLLLCPSKVRRERVRWGAVRQKEHAAQPLPGGVYGDGKICPTLVRDTTTTTIQERGKRGRASRQVVSTTSNKLQQTEHFTLVSQPGKKYITHVSPPDGTGRSVATEIVDAVREREIPLKVLGMDGCPTNTGIHNGAMRLVEVMLGEVVQHVVCLLHLGELPFRHELEDVDGSTTGPSINI